jgi:hypothetical protein
MLSWADGRMTSTADQYLPKKNTNRHTSWVGGKEIRHDIISQIIAIPINTLTSSTVLLYEVHSRL